MKDYCVKGIFILLALCWAVTAGAQATNSAAPSGRKTVQARPAYALRSEYVPLEASPPNETKLGKLTASGIVVEAVKTRNPLQLINPVAPSQYSAEDNLIRDPISNRPSGLKLFSLQF